MATPVTVPSLGEEDAAAVLIRFLVEPGQAVHRGDPLYELDTDKVTQEVEAEADGVLLDGRRHARRRVPARRDHRLDR